MSVLSVNDTKAHAQQEQALHGLTGAFRTGELLVEATRKAYEAGFRQMDAYSPIPVDGLAEAMGRRGTAMPLIVLGGGIIGALTGWFMQWFSAVYDYPFNIGGRPFNSWPMFIPIIFELTVLFAAVSGVLGMLFLNGLPRLHHPIFAASGIERATVDRFFLCLEAADPRWDRTATRRFLEDELHAENVVEVPR